MPEPHTCPTRDCGRPMRAGDLVCHRCWYVVPDDLRKAYLAALAAFKQGRAARHVPALLAAQKAAIDSVSPERGT